MENNKEPTGNKQLATGIGQLAKKLAISNRPWFSLPVAYCL
jgi:hypothetical protein